MGGAVADIAAGGPLAYDGPFWQRQAPGNFVAKAARNGIPALMWLGWNDLVTTGGPNLYTEFQNAAGHRPIYSPMTPGQRVTGRDQIVIGPWNHCFGIDQSLELEPAGGRLVAAPGADTWPLTQGRLWRFNCAETRAASGEVLVLPAGERCRAYRWPRDAPEAAVLSPPTRLAGAGLPLRPPDRSEATRRTELGAHTPAGCPGKRGHPPAA